MEGTGGRVLRAGNFPGSWRELVVDVDSRDGSVQYPESLVVCDTTDTRTGEKERAGRCGTGG